MQSDKAASNPLFDMNRFGESASLPGQRSTGPKPPDEPPPVHDDTAIHAAFDKMTKEAAMKHDAVSSKPGSSGIGKTNKT